MSVPFSLAPMASLTHRAFRELFDMFGGPDIYYTEMVSAGAIWGGGRFEAYYIDPLPHPERLIYQIVGGEPETLAKAAAFLDERGTYGIDVNMGCSAPEILRAGGGARWMMDEDATRRMIAMVRKAMRGRLSVKLRLGVDEGLGRLARFCTMLQDEGVEALTLHPRTSTEKFKRKARWEYVGALRAELKIPVTGNGDVDTPSALVARASGDCDGVMVGRAAVRCPWIFAAARELESSRGTAPFCGARGNPLPEQVDLEEISLRFLDLLAAHQPPEFHESRARRFFAYFCDNLKWAHHVKTLLGRETELSAMARVLHTHFEENPEERWLRPIQ